MSLSTLETIERLEACRAREKEQALRYRWLAARAEETAPDLAPTFHNLHADEQHHLSRLTARILELGGRPIDLSATKPATPELDGWKQNVEEWETIEVERYRGLLEEDFDVVTRALLVEIFEVEEHHQSELGGKWTLA